METFVVDPLAQVLGPEKFTLILHRLKVATFELGGRMIFIVNLDNEKLPLLFT
jgi:hypothetical protein